MSHLVERADHSHAKVSLVQRRWSASMRLPLELVVEVGNRVGNTKHLQLGQRLRMYNLLIMEGNRTYYLCNKDIWALSAI